MVNAPKKAYSPLPAGEYGKSTTMSTRRRHHANEGKSDLEVERVRALGALRWLWCKKKLSAEKRRETDFLSNDEKDKCIKDYVEKEITVARKRVQDAETAIMQELNDMATAENVGATTGKPKTTFDEMLYAIRDTLSDLACSVKVQDGEEEKADEEDTELSTLSDDDESSWVMGRISNTVLHRLETCRQKQMKLEEFTQPGWGDAANCFRERNMKYEDYPIVGSGGC